jgi:ABC-type branched-subunit amino acid transport system ATPase component
MMPPGIPPNGGVAAPPPHDELLQVAGLRATLSGVRAVDGVSFSVPAGTIIGLIGPNGAGKSTTLKLIAGSLRPDSGHVRYAGHDITGRPAHQIARRGLVRTFQLSSEFARLTVLENLLVAAVRQRGASVAGALAGKRYWRAQEAQLTARARQLLAEFHMSHVIDSYAGQLSGGQKRIVEIMRALMAAPRMLLLDEPLAGVSPSLRDVIAGHLVRLREQGLTMVMVEHELGAVEQCCDSVIVMAQGRILAEGSMGQMRANKEVVDAYLLG